VIGALAFGRLDHRRVAILASAVAGGGVAIAAGPELSPLVVAGAVLAMACAEWRRGVVVLLCALPFSGVPVFIAGAPGLALRDLAIVLPIYASFAFACTLPRGAEILPRAGVLLPALALFCLAVIVSIAAAPSLTVAAIGTKVWLVYLPMLAIGYRYVRRIEDFDSVLRLTALLGLVPALIALAECIIASRAEHAVDPALLRNDFGPFRYLYGDWYSHVSAPVLSFYRPGGHIFVIARVPSTFTASTQYFAFAMVAFAAGLAQAMRAGSFRWTVCAALLAAGALAAGARLAYVLVPVTLVTAVAIGRPERRYALAVGGGVLAAAAAAVAAGADVAGIVSLLPHHVAQQSAHACGEFARALGTGAWGHGTGWDTNAALRYGDVAERRYIENWYAKAVLELGLGGLAAMVVALAALHWRIASGLRRVSPDVRQLAAPVAVVLGVMTIALFKGPYIDLDPLNVYYWLLAGMLLAVIRIGVRGDATAPRTGEER